ncbi:MAG TPA: bifunctional diaminohydroxyphosphoribosylaminopyrimidine deaminase/5-amino-6-(5-phosphoribosylamino)uracil reductase RibD [Chthoniobacterales bacterium]|nr:bifunctional diaminohydroxyphosphoribosylaminopyrimidine deaminase/5-amino-6-(5-phosphoribosylamino)uracil reductase RibD [Chthoniobacterales bacterium]
MAIDKDQKFMRQALREARRGLGHTSPNPAVGAVLVIDGKVVARGYHRRAGAPHAEIECLRGFGKRVPKRAILYVTLEPCSTVGRTGACTAAIGEAGVRQLVIGAIDPNPRHAGRGIDLLTKAGIAVRTGVLANECSALNEAYDKWIQTGRPFVIAKCGMSLDGRLTRPPGEDRWLTSTASRKDVHKLRAQVDAILVGAETVRADDPQLTVRGVPGARQPWRIVLSRSGKLPRDAKIFVDRFSDRTLVYRQIAMETLLQDLGAREITSVLIEGGGEILSQALDERVIDRVQIYLAPRFTGGPKVAFAGSGAATTAESLRLRDIRYEKTGADICVTGYPGLVAAE